MASGEVREYLKEENSEYQWSLTPSGDLLIYYKEFHKQFTMAAIKDQRIAAFGAGVWAEVEIIPSEDDDEPKQIEVHSVLESSK
jgi:hypothetical protein